MSICLKVIKQNVIYVSGLEFAFPWLRYEIDNSTEIVMNRNIQF